MTDIAERIEVWQGDITTLAVDAIVNAANEQLVPGGGVCGAIHRAAGPELAAACAKIGRCPTGGARMTSGFKLKAKQVIHAVGPRWQGGTDDEERLLAAAYKSSLDLATKHRLTSLAFPAISTGIYGFPLESATRIAIETVRRHLEKNAQPSKVTFAVFGSQAGAIYRKALAG